MSDFRFSVSNQDKDRGSLHQRSNTKINNRSFMDMEIFGNRGGFTTDPINKMNIERDEFFINSKSFKSDDVLDNNLQEENINFDDFKVDRPSRGMPFRSSMINNKKFGKDKMDEEICQQNNNSDFIYKKQNNTRIKLDPYIKESFNATFSDINTSSRLSSDLENDNICSSGINDFSLFLLKNLNNILKSPFVINTFDIYSIFATIYLGSQKNTEIELKNYFNYPRKDILESGLNSLISEVRTNTKTGNCILFNDELTFNPDFYKLVSNISKMRKINVNSSTKEADIINQIVNDMVEHNMKKSVTSTNLEQLNMLLLTFGYFNPTINITGEYKLLKDNFNSKYFNNITTDYAVLTNCHAGFLETEKFKIVEFACNNDKSKNIMFGLLLPLVNIAEIKENEISNNFKNFKLIKFNKIMFPLFTILTKLRFRNIFKRTDLLTVFSELSTPELFQDNSKIDDVLQNVQFNLYPNFNIIKTEDKRSPTRDIIFNRSFIYYLRLRDKTTLLSIGIY